MHITEQAISNLYSGLIYDALKHDLRLDQPFVLDNRIVPLHGGKVFGPAFTCRGEQVLAPEEIRDHIRIEMLQKMPRGCVKMVANGSSTVAISGDITCLLDARHGARGCILDGFVRDVDLIRTHQPDFSLYGRGCSPLAAFGIWQIVEYQVPVCFPGLTGEVVVRPNDFIFADASGCLVIPQEHQEATLRCSLDRFYGEDKIRQRILESDNLADIYQEEVRW